MEIWAGGGGEVLELGNPGERGSSGLGNPVRRGVKNACHPLGVCVFFLE